MTVRSSFNETATWNAGKSIYRGPSAYSDLVAFGDKRAGVLFENGAISPYEKITFSSWADGWLDDTTITQLDFREQTAGAAPASAGALLDARGYGLNGTAIGAPTYVAGDPRWGNGSALRFSTSTDVVRVPDSGFSSPLDSYYNDSFTLDCVFRTTEHAAAGVDNSGPLISKDGNAANLPGYSLRVEGGVALFSLVGSTGAVSLTSSVPVSDGDWHYVTAIRDVALDQIRLFVDFKLVGTAVDTTTGGFSNNNPLLVGAMNGAAAGTAQFVGDIDFIRLSAGAINPSEFSIAVPEPATAVAIVGVMAGAMRRRRSF
jgi:sialidase-1